MPRKAPPMFEGGWLWLGKRRRAAHHHRGLGYARCSLGLLPQCFGSREHCSGKGPPWWYEFRPRSLDCSS